MAGGDPGCLLCGGFKCLVPSAALTSALMAQLGVRPSREAPGACGEFPSMESPRGLHGGGGKDGAGEPPGVAAVNEDTHTVSGVYWKVLGSAKARLWRTSTLHVAF